jgi:Ulp1 family protease
MFERNLLSNKVFIIKDGLLDKDSVADTVKYSLMLRKAIPKNIVNEYTKWYFIYNIDYQHYVLFELNNLTKTMAIYDSLNSDNTKLADDINSLLYKVVKQSYIYDNSKTKDLPKQKNTCDCGVFVLLYLYFLVMDIEPNTTNINVNEMVNIRIKLLCSLLNGKLQF